MYELDIRQHCKEPVQRGCDLAGLSRITELSPPKVASPGDKRPFLRDSCKCIRVALNIHNALKSVLDHRAVSSITRVSPSNHGPIQHNGSECRDTYQKKYKCIKKKYPARIKKNKKCIKKNIQMPLCETS